MMHLLRPLIRDSRFLLVGAAVVGLGMGGCALLFALVNGLVRAPFGVDEPNNIMACRRVSATESTWWWSHDEYLALEAGGEAKDIAGYANDFGTIRGIGETRRVGIGKVTPHYFRLLGVKPAAGRVFGPGDEQENVSVVSARLEAEIGTVLYVNGVATTVIGVLPEHFGGFSFEPVDVWVPDVQRWTAATGGDRLSSYLKLLVRLDSPSSKGRTEAQLTGTARRSLQSGQEGGFQRLELVPRPWIGQEAAAESSPLVAIAAATMVCFLLISLGHAAGLFAVRVRRRRRELGTKLTLGAAPWRLILELLAECVAVCMLAGVIAGLSVVWAIRAFSAWASSPSAQLLLSRAWPPDLSLAVFVLLLVLGSAVVVCLPSVHEIMKTSPLSWLRHESQGRSPRRGRWLIAGAQIVGACVLIATAASLANTVHTLSAIPSGYRLDSLLLATVHPQELGYSKARTQELARELTLRTSTAADVAGFSIARLAPLSQYGSSHPMAKGGDSGEPGRQDFRRVSFNVVGPQHFANVGLPILRGVDFTTEGAESVPTIAVNETMARSWWPDQDPMGKLVWVWQEDLPRTVVAVVGDAKEWGLTHRPRPYAYLPLLREQPLRNLELTLHIRPRSNDGAALEAVREILRDIEPDMALDDIRQGTDQVVRYNGRSIAFGSVLAIVGVLATVLAAVGLYVTLVQLANERRYEIAVRTAMGAGPLTIVTMVMREALFTVAIGLVVGIGASVAVSSAVARALEDVGSAGAWVLAAAAASVCVVSLLASLKPAVSAALEGTQTLMLRSQ
jgi:predicted permease